MKLFVTLLVIVPIAWMSASFLAPSKFTIGRMAPAFGVTLTEGKELRLRDLRGKVVLLNFWASWCPPCQTEASDLEAAWQEYKDKDVVFLGIKIQNDKPEDAHRFLKNFGITYPNGWDNGRISDRYSVWGIPKTYIIDPKGRTTYIHLGAISSAIIMDKVGEARRGLISASEGKGSYQSISLLSALIDLEQQTKRLEERALGRNGKKERKLQLKEKYGINNVKAVKYYKGQWVKILLKDGSEREGTIVNVKEDMVQLQQSFVSGSFSIHVPIHQIENFH